MKSFLIACALAAQISQAIELRGSNDCQTQMRANHDTITALREELQALQTGSSSGSGGEEQNNDDQRPPRPDGWPDRPDRDPRPAPSDDVDDV